MAATTSRDESLRQQLAGVLGELNAKFIALAQVALQRAATTA
jgi:hypothetical protein